jgi:hypothetical protein
MAESFAYCRPPRKCRDVSAATKAIESKLVREPCVASTISGPCRAPAPVPPPICVDACDCQARSSEMKNRWSNAAPFVSLLDGWPEYDYPAYAVACVSKSFARGSAASRLPCSCSPAMPATAKHGEQKTAGRTRLHSLASVTAGPGFLPWSALLRLHTPRRRCQPLSLCPLSPATPATVEHDPAK